MPSRTNLFQEVVASVHRHMAGEAVVEESAMLTHRLTGELREVDVVVRGTVAGQPVVIGVEATAAGRPATVQWVEQLVAKHRELETNKLVLVASGGFAGSARRLAESYGVAAIAPDDLDGGDPTYAIVNNLKSLWAKVYSASATTATMRIEDDAVCDTVEIVDPPLALDIFNENGVFLCPLNDLILTAVRTHVQEHTRSDKMRDEAVDRTHNSR